MKIGTRVRVNKNIEITDISVGDTGIITDIDSLFGWWVRLDDYHGSEIAFASSELKAIDGV